jgi:hypothetical protein
MMTVLYRGRKDRRYFDIPLHVMDFPRSWGAAPESRTWAAAGSATPGRGGRRKRRRRAAADRAYSMLDVLPPGPRAHEATMRFFRLHPSRFPWLFGRRERRRRAKLRRRRARAEARKAARAFLLALPAFYGRPTHRETARIAQQKIEERRRMQPGMWRALAMAWMFKRESQRLREMMLTRGA